MNYLIIMHDIDFPGFNLNMLGWIALSALVSYFILNILVGYFRKDAK